jgi:hypothetical protein
LVAMAWRWWIDHHFCSFFFHVAYCWSRAAQFSISVRLASSGWNWWNRHHIEILLFRTLGVQEHIVIGVYNFWIAKWLGLNLRLD